MSSGVLKTTRHAGVFPLAAVVAGLLPLVGVNLAYLLSAGAPGLCAAMLLLGLSTIPAPLIFSDMVTFERVMEWNFSLLVLAFFPVTAFAWHADGFRPEFLVRSR